MSVRSEQAGVAPDWERSGWSREVAIIERMGRDSGSLDVLRPRRFDLVLVGAAVLMSVLTVILAADVDLRPSRRGASG